jgi:hypothetical protein
MKFQPQRRIDQAAVQKSLRELALLFGKRPPDTKENAPRQRGENQTQLLIRSQTNESEHSNLPRTQGQPLITLRGIGQ